MKRIVAFLTSLPPDLAASTEGDHGPSVTQREEKQVTFKTFVAERRREETLMWWG